MKRAYRWLAVKPQDRETPQLVRERVKCGKPSCRCTRGVRHGPYWYFPYMNIRRACAGAALGQTCSRGELAHEILPERTTAMPARAPANWRTGPSELTTALASPSHDASHSHCSGETAVPRAICSRATD
jgi:hypothetical protein